MGRKESRGQGMMVDRGDIREGNGRLLNNNFVGFRESQENEEGLELNVKPHACDPLTADQALKYLYKLTTNPDRVD